MPRVGPYGPAGCEWVFSLMRATSAIMPGDDLLFQRLSVSTIGADRFHGRVRDGIGWDTVAMVTRQYGRRAHEVFQSRCLTTAFGRDLYLCVMLRVLARILVAPALRPCGPILTDRPYQTGFLAGLLLMVRIHQA